MIEKKGFILSLDAAVAVVLLIIILAGSSYFFLKTNENFISNVQMLRIGSDITAVLEADGTLDTLDSTSIKSGIEKILPVSYSMRLTINSTRYSSPIIVETESLPSDKKFVVAGKRYFYAGQGSQAFPSIVQYEVWPR